MWQIKSLFWSCVYKEGKPETWQDLRVQEV
jgi:hypothetical protein